MTKHIRMTIFGNNSKSAACLQSVLLIFAMLLPASCSKYENDRCVFDYSVTATRKVETTKTTISGLSLNWDDNDAIGMYIDGIQNNVLLNNDGGNAFSGMMNETGKQSSSAEYVAYYPYTTNSSGKVISGVLSKVQTAPFDSRYDYMVSSTVKAAYDEENMPSVSFQFGNHIFGILKVDIKNTADSLKNEKLSSVKVSVENGYLAGQFTVDVSNGARARPRFSGDAYDNVTMAYSSGKEEVLGLNKTHSLYLVVMAGTCRGLSVRIVTDNYSGEVTSDEFISFTSGYVTSVPAVDFSKIAVPVPKPHVYKYKCAFMGDSITDYWDNKDPEWFSSNNYLNKGISGQSTTEMLNRFQKDIIKNDPQATIILGGINDYYYKKIANDSITVDNIKKMAFMADTSGIEVLLCSIMLTSGSGSLRPDGRTNKECIQEMNRQIREYAEANGHTYVDYYTLLTDENGNYVGSYFSDGVHPTLATYKIMEAYVKPIIDSVLVAN